MTARGFGLTALIAGVLACGGRADAPRSVLEDEPGTSDRMVPATLPDVETPRDDETPRDESPTSVEPEQPLSELEGEALRILDERCGACHSHGMDQGGLGDLLDLQVLLETGLLQPRPAEASRLILMLRYGDRIAEHAYPLPSEGELDTLIRFIDGLPELEAGCGSEVDYSPDALQRVLLDDISRYPAPDRAFIRYLVNPESGLCGPRGQQNLLFDVMNGTSSAARAVLPRCEPWTWLYCAIDLRDYGWNRPIDVDGDAQPDFDDAWQAAVDAAAPYAVQMTGTEAVEVSSQTQTLVPVLPLPAFVHAVATSPLYYALTDASAVLQDMVSSYGDRIGASPPDIVRAGLFGTAPRPDRAITRLGPSGAQTGAIWTLEELPGTLREALVYRSFGGGEVMFGLPNGMWAFALAGANGAVLAELPGCFDNACATRALSPVTCMACHQRGLLGVADPWAPMMEMGLSPSYDADTHVAAQAQYVADDTLAALIDEDNQREANAREAVGAEVNGANRIPRAVFLFEKPLSLSAAAGELGLDAPRLREALIARSADPRIAPLQPLLTEGARVHRRLFSEAYQTLLCEHDGMTNRPASCVQ